MFSWKKRLILIVDIAYDATSSNTSMPATSWKGNQKSVMVTDGIEPATNGLLDQRSTDWAMPPMNKYNTCLKTCNTTGFDLEALARFIILLTAPKLH